MRMVKEEASPGAYVYHAASQTLDLAEYSWVKDFVRDQELRKEMTELEAEIIKTQNSPVDRSELRARFDQQREGIKQEFSELTVDSLKKMQDRKSHVLLADMGAQQLIRVHLLSLTEKDIDGIFARLPAGVLLVDINKKVTKLEKRIFEIQQEIARDLSPKTRWFYTPSGDAEPYSKGCRWFQLVSEWRQEASRCSGECNFRGEKPNEAEKVAYHFLKLDEVMKVEPLHEPRD